MTANKKCNTINQNIEPCDSNAVEQNKYTKQFGTLLANEVDMNNRSQFSTISQQVNNNLLVEKLEQVDDYMKPNAVWDRGKEPLKTYESIKQLQHQLESLESCLSLEHQRKSPTFKSVNMLNAYLLNSEENNNDDIDLESFDSKSIKLNNSVSGEIKLSNEINRINDSVETDSLSNFHNVRDVLSTIKLRLEQCLNSNHDISGSSKLEEHIGELTRELECYAKRLNERKEYELRKFSENMSSQMKLVHIQNAFLKKEQHSTSLQSYNIYDTLMSSDEYSHYTSDSMHQNYRDNTLDGFFMKNCYDRASFESNFDTNSVEYYSMLISEERPENLLNDAPTLLPRYQERESRISLIFQNPDNNVINEWQKYQLNTITIKPKRNKYSKDKTQRKEKKRKSYPNVWSFTLDYHKTRMLQMKLEKEKKIRFICRIFFYLFGLACFIVIVLSSQSFFNTKQSKYI